LAKKGLKVLILEKERLPRPKVCAGGLPVKVAQLLDFDLSPAFETQVFRSLPPFEADLGEMGGWTVTRANLDHLMAEIYYPLPALGYRLCRGSKIIREGIIEIVQGKMRYGEFFWGVMRNLPRVLSEGLR